MEYRKQMPRIFEIGSGLVGKCAPIAGDDYVPNIILSQVATDGIPAIAPEVGYTDETEEQTREREIERIREYDKPIKPYIFQISVPGAGAALSFAQKIMAKVFFSVVKKAGVKIIDSFKEDAEVAKFKKQLQGNIEKHYERMRDPIERSREQQTIDRIEHRERIGDRTQVA